MKRLLLVLIVCLPSVFMQTRSAQASTYINRINDEHPIIEYSILASAGDYISITMTRLSGDLVPFLAFGPDAETVTVRSDVNNKDMTTSLNYTFIESGAYVLLATRSPFAGVDTVGEFVLVVNGTVRLDNETVHSLLPAYTEPTFFYPSVKNGAELTGHISDQNSVDYYQVYLEPFRIADITARSDSSSDLQPMIVLFAIDNSSVVRGTISEETLSKIVSSDIPGTGWYVLAITRIGAENGETSGDYLLEIVVE